MNKAIQSILRSVKMGDRAFSKGDFRLLSFSLLFVIYKSENTTYNDFESILSVYTQQKREHGFLYPLSNDITVKQSKVVTDIAVRLSKFFADFEKGKNTIFELYSSLSSYYQNSAKGSQFDIKHSEIITEYLGKQAYKTVYDPAIGTSISLLQSLTRHNDMVIYGEEINEQLSNTAQIILESLNIENNIQTSDSIESPSFTSDSSLKQFDVVYCQPPVGRTNLSENCENDRYSRFKTRVSRTHDIEIPFMYHVLSSMSETGVGFVIVPNRVLFAPGRIYDIRKYLIDSNVVESIINLPKTHRVAVGFNILILKKNRTTSTVEFRDCSIKYPHASLTIDVATSDIVENDYSFMIENYKEDVDNNEEINAEQLEQEILLLEHEIITIQKELMLKLKKMK